MPARLRLGRVNIGRQQVTQRKVLRIELVVQSQLIGRNAMGELADIFGTNCRTGAYLPLHSKTKALDFPA